MITPKIIIKDYIDLIDNHISELECTNNKYINYFEGRSASFKPSKTAQNCLNFIQQQDEKILINQNITDDIYDIIKIIYTLLNIEILNKENCISYLYNTVMLGYNVDSLSIIILI